MAQQELSCSACGTRFLSQAFCPSCGVPSVIASAEQQMLWEMGQVATETVAPAPAAIKLATVPAIAHAAEPAVASSKPAASKPKPFSPVPLPRRATEGGARPAPPRNRVAERAPIRSTPADTTPSEPDRSQEVAEGSQRKPGARTARKTSAPEPINDDAIKELPAPTKAKPRVVTGSVIKRAGPHPADEPAPQQPPVVTRASKREARKQIRTQRKIDKLLEHLRAAEGESVTASLDGTLGFRPATLLITNYRIAIVPRAKRWKCRWIPLEEVTRISCPVGSSNLVVDASVEVLRFGARRAHKLQAVVALLRAEVKEARTGRGAHRHNAVIVQAWCDRTSEIWDSPLGRIRLWLDHHPKLRLFMFSPLIPLAFLIKQSL